MGGVGGVWAEECVGDVVVGGGDTGPRGLVDDPVEEREVRVE